MTQGLLRDEAGVRLEPRVKPGHKLADQAECRPEERETFEILASRGGLGSGHLIDKFKEDAGGKSLKNDKNDSSQWSQVT